MQTIAEQATTTSMHLLTRFVYSPSLLARLARIALATVAVGLGLRSFVNLLFSMASPEVYRMDFPQLYFMASAFGRGMDLYLPLNVLAEKLTPESTVSLPSHPTPHPPTMGLLILPLGWVDYTTSATIWFLAKALFFLPGTVFLLFRATSPPTGIARIALLSVALLAWYPVNYELYTGQVTLPILFFVIAARHALLRQRETLAGAMLALALLMKPVTWPLMVPLLIRRRWMALGATVGGTAVGYALALAVLGPAQLIRYFIAVPATVTALYQASPWSLSLWGLGWRVFAGTHSPIMSSLQAPPLVDLSALAPVAAVLLTTLSVVGGSLITRRCSLDCALGAVLALSIVVSPVAWDYYLPLAILPVAQLVEWLAQHRLPIGPTMAALWTGMLLSVSTQHWGWLAVMVSGLPISDDALHAFPPGLALLTMMPAVGALMLAGLVSWIGVKSSRSRLGG